MRYFIITCVLFASGCTTIVGKPKFPEIPEQLLQPCKDLEVIGTETVTLSKLMETVAKNYKSRHECALQVNSFAEWYNTQKQLFEKE